MTQMLGMDPDAILALAGKLSSQTDSISATVADVDRLVNLIASQWHGQDGTDFLQSWQRMHRPALVAAHGAVAGLAQSARNNVHQQVETSSTVGGGPGAVSLLVADVKEGKNLSRHYGWIAAPVVGLIPGVQTIQSIDSSARIDQDIGERHYMAAFQQDSSQVSSGLLDAAAQSRDPFLALDLGLGALNVSLWSGVVVAASQDHLSTFTTFGGILTALHSGGLHAADEMLRSTAVTVGHQLGAEAASFGEEAWGAVGGLI